MTSIPVKSTIILAAALALAGCADLGSTSAPSDTEQVASAAFAVGDHAEAARLYERAAERDPKSVEALLGLGRAYHALGQPNRAQSALERARVLDRRNTAVLNEMGALALSRMHPREAIGYYDEVLTRDRSNLGALTGKAVALDFLSQHLEAQGVYRLGLAAYPTNFVLLSNFALSQVLSGQIGAGTALMEELLRDPERGDAVRGNLAIAYALDGRDRDARATLAGTMSEAQIQETLQFHADLRARHQAGQPIGYLIFN